MDAHIRLVISDVDGTLVTKDKTLTARTIAAVHLLHDAGIAFAITSSRPPCGLRMLIGPLDISTPMAAVNGGLIVNPDMTVIEQHVLAADVARSVLDTIEEHPPLDAWIYRGCDWFVRNREAPHVAREERTVQFVPIVVPSFDDVLNDIAKIVGVSDDYDAVARCEAALQKTCGKQANAKRSQPYYVDVTHPTANKGFVVAWMSEFLHVPREQIAAIGDGLNDIQLFDRSGLSIAMGNADEAVKQKANHVTDSNEAEGFAKAVERYILAPASAGSDRKA